MKLATTHCQICARPIFAKTGVIAHHGYTRPGQGWQTGSCYGARHLPYEQSCDLIPLYIAMVESHKVRAQTRIAELTASPPDSMIINRSKRYRPDITVTRPDNFDVSRRPASYRPDSYEQAFWSTIWGCEQTVRQADLTIRDMNKRLADWQKIEEVEA